MVPRIEKLALHLALLVAWVAMLGSLYFSEVRHYVPCTWCWYQRILMYPMALFLAVGLLRRDEQLPYYSVVFSALGMAASTYHYLLQKTTWFSGAVACTAGVPCTTQYINWFGFVTIPFLALIAFTLIFFASVIVITSPEPVWDGNELDEKGASWVPVVAIIALVLLAFASGFLM
ncbi:MAG: disulfide oxidoreductase [Candidatus Binatia bacterium]